MSANVLIVHGGGTMTVINVSPYGAVEEAKKPGSIGKAYGAIDGSGEILKESFLGLMQVPEEKLNLLFQTPTIAIGSFRYALGQEGYDAMAGIFRKHGIRYMPLNGGSGAMNTCDRIFEACRGEGIYAMEVPRTIDNGIVITGYTPGYGSATRFIVASTAEVGANVRVLPIHVCVMEAMGRNARWIAAAPAPARKKLKGAPHLIYLPERSFHGEEFLEDAKRLHEEKGDVVVVASEGLKSEKGEPIVPPVFKAGGATYYGDVSAYPANLVIQRPGVKARSERPGLCERASIVWQSPVGQEETALAGGEALHTAMVGGSDVMIGPIQNKNEDGGYHVHTSATSIKEVVPYERVLPDEYINNRSNNVIGAFLKWCKPLTGPELGDFVDSKEEHGKVGVGK